MQFDPKKTVFLIDASNFLYRSYYGLAPLHTKTGEAVQAVYSFCRTLKKLISTYSPQYIALVWDSKGKTKRHNLFPDYKAHRQVAPSDLFTQKDYIVRFADIIGLKQVFKDGCEADDLIASMTQQCANADMQVVILSSDKDLGQLLSDNVFLLDVFKDKITTKEAFEKAQQFSVSHLKVFYGLVGDSSDNIPGVAGVGKKSAQYLAKQYGSMQEIYSNIDFIEPKRIRTALKEHQADAFLSEKLFTLDFDVIQCDKEDLLFNQNTWFQAGDFFEKLGFESLLKDFPQNEKQKKELSENKYAYWKKYNFQTIVTLDKLEKLIKTLECQNCFVFDTETTGIDPLNTALVGISFSYNKTEAFYIPCGHKEGDQIDIKIVIQMIKPLFENEKIKKIAHNAKFDMLVLSQYQIDVLGEIFDTYIASQLVFEESMRLSLKLLSSNLFNEEMFSYDEIVVENGYKNFSEVSLEMATLYSSSDSRQTYLLYKVLEEKLQEQKQETIIYEIENPLIPVLVAMEKIGIYCDKQKLFALQKKIDVTINKIDFDIRAIIDDQFINLNSPQQIRVLLFEKLKLPSQKKSAKGAFSTDSEVLELLSDMHIVPKMLLRYRELMKLKSTYIDALPNYINIKDGKIHTTFSQIKTATGRLSSSNPNLQNIPAELEGFGSEIREAFCPIEGQIFISVDYSQIELRVLAYLSQDITLVNAFLHDKDIHAETAALLFSVPFEQVTHEQRQIGKRINFSILYGLTPYGLSKDLKIPFSDAKNYIAKYFEQYQGVSKWMIEVINFTIEHGYVQTFWGRRRMVPNIYQKNKLLFEEAKRVAINTVAQGTAADLVKKGMILVHNWLQKECPSGGILLQIHDELLLSVPAIEVEHVMSSIQKILESVVSWNVPLKVTIRQGKNWKEVTK